MTTSLRAVFFDAVGTLLHPSPSAAEAYFRAGRRHGSQLTFDTVAARFADAFRAEEADDARHAHRTSEERESERWRRIVVTVLDDVGDVEACFDELYEHFAQPTNWHCEPEAGFVVEQLRRSGIAVGLASNFDHRLRTVVAGTPELANLDHIAVSSELGWKKPARAFYSALTEMAGCSADEILIVGDDLENDVLAPRRYGLGAMLFDPKDRGDGDRIRTLGELLERVKR